MDQTTPYKGTKYATPEEAYKANIRKTVERRKNDDAYKAYQKEYHRQYRLKKKQELEDLRTEKIRIEQERIKFEEEKLRLIEEMAKLQIKPAEVLECK